MTIIIYIDTTKSDNILQQWDKNITMCHGDHIEAGGL